MSRSDYRRLLDHGRKAGLTTREIYSALATQPPQASDYSSRIADGNGFVSDYTQGRARVYRPMNEMGPN
jgi:hypothetical protein